MNYQQKYLKYKMKYLELKNILQHGYGKHNLYDNEGEEEDIEADIEADIENDPKINEFLTNLVTLNYENIDTNKAQIEKLLNEININLLKRYTYTEIDGDEVNRRDGIPLIILIKLNGVIDTEIYKDLLKLFRQKIDVTDENKQLMKYIFTTVQSLDIDEDIKEFIRDLFKDFEIKKIRANRCKEGVDLIPIKNIIITNVIINTIENLPNEKRGVFKDVDVKEKLIADGFEIVKDDRFVLHKMENIMKHKFIDDVNYPIKVISNGNNKYKINDGYHRVTRSLIDGKDDICAIIQNK